MHRVSYDAVETAESALNEARAEYDRGGDREALYRYIEALRAYRTVLRNRYNLR